MGVRSSHALGCVGNHPLPYSAYRIGVDPLYERPVARAFEPLLAQLLFDLGNVAAVVCYAPTFLPPLHSSTRPAFCAILSKCLPLPTADGSNPCRFIFVRAHCTPIDG